MVVTAIKKPMTCWIMMMHWWVHCGKGRQFLQRTRIQSKMVIEILFYYGKALLRHAYPRRAKILDCTTSHN
jgi:hypothetical protein